MQQFLFCVLREANLTYLHGLNNGHDENDNAMTEVMTMIDGIFISFDNLVIKDCFDNLEIKDTPVVDVRMEVPEAAASKGRGTGSIATSNWRTHLHVSVAVSVTY